jgi:hypothetical protein
MKRHVAVGLGLLNSFSTGGVILLALGNRSDKRDQGAGEGDGAGRLDVCRLGVWG